MAQRCQSVRSPAPTTPRPTGTTTARPNPSRRPQIKQTNFNSPNCVSFQHLGKKSIFFLKKHSKLRISPKRKKGIPYSKKFFSGYICVPKHQCVNGRVDKTQTRNRIQNRNRNDVAILFNLRPKSSSSSNKFTPWTKKCNGWQKMCCKDPNFRPPSTKAKPVSNSSNRNLMNTNTKNLCPSGYSGLRPVPYDCTKFANCWKGRAIIQSCGPGNVDFTEKIKLLNFYFIFKKILFFS